MRFAVRQPRQGLLLVVRNLRAGSGMPTDGHPFIKEPWVLGIKMAVVPPSCVIESPYENGAI